MENQKKLLDPKFLAKISNLYLVARTVVEGFISGLHRSLYKGFSVEFFEHREYSAGDDLRYLDWKVFARTDRLYLKTFREETNVKGYILLDTSASMGYRSKEISKLEYGIFLSASLSYLMISQKDAVGLITFDKDIKSFIKPMSTTFHLHTLIENLKNLKPGRETSLSDVLNKIATAIKRRSLIILISDLFDEPESVMKGLSHFKSKHHEIIVFHILDPYEISFPFSGNYEFVDMETNEKVAVDADYIRDTYRNLFDDFLDFYRVNCSKKNISYALGKTDTPFDYFLYQYLSRRAKCR
ncbi:MAG: DUF58 domain-containing protein [Candidatus Omnitrophota bacterium]|nr:MAG: DUF58 domain-containing protein [Candidatus Omnitrophota bacterium]